MMRIGSLFLLFNLFGCGPDALPAVDAGEPTQTDFDNERIGEGTYYDADGSGNCSFDALPGENILIAALNNPDWANSGWCGACADVDGPDGSVQVRIVDKCPECATGDLDMSPFAFQQIAPLEDGRVPITWKFVPCNDTPQQVSYRYKDGSNQWWTAVQVLDNRMPVAKLEWAAGDDGVFVEMMREDFNFFIEPNGFGDGAVRIRVTGIDGTSFVDELPAVQADLIVGGSGQL